MLPKGYRRAFYTEEDYRREGRTQLICMGILIPIIFIGLIVFVVLYGFNLMR